MGLRTATFTLTCGSEGYATDDVALPRNTRVRGARVVAVTLEADADNDGTPDVTFAINELTDVSDEDWNDSTEDFELGRQLFAGDTRFVGTDTIVDGTFVAEWRPGVNAATRYGDAPSVDLPVSDVFIKSSDVRCDLYAGGSGEANAGFDGNVYTVTMYYETAGDYRW